MGILLNSYTNNPDISVVLGINGDVQTALKSLGSAAETLTNAGAMEVVIADNSGDSLIASTFSQIPDAKFATTSRIPWTDAWSNAIEQATGTYVLLLSADVQLMPGWYATAANAFTTDPTCTAVTPSIMTAGSMRTMTSQPPEIGTGVCLLVRRSALFDGTISEAKHVPESVVALLSANIPTAVAAVEDDSRLVAAAQRASSQTATDPNYVAPGGGAPIAPTRFVATADGADDTTKARRLNLGCGPNQMNGWTNIDGDPACNPDLVLDLRAGLPFADASIDYIYSEHFFEHLGLDLALHLLSECARVLTPTGVIRTAMPDLKTLVLQYLNDTKGADWLQYFPEVDTPARFLNLNFFSWGHQYLFDVHDFTKRLQSVGFGRIAEVPWGQSQHPALAGLETRTESFLIVEASK